MLVIRIDIVSCHCYRV